MRTMLVVEHLCAAVFPSIDWTTISTLVEPFPLLLDLESVWAGVVNPIEEEMELDLAQRLAPKQQLSWREV